MELYKYKWIGLFVLMAVSLGCNKNVLNVKNLNAIEPGLTWSDPALANAYLANLYKRVMPPGWPARSGALYGGLGVDDTRGIINQNSIQASSHPWSGVFEDQYVDIRQMNILLKEIETGTLDQATKDKIVGQTLFLRAYSYFLLVRVYGGVPILLEPQELGQDLQVARASTAEVFTAIEADLTKAGQLLNGQVFADGDKGRIGSAAVAALKGRVALYKASPLFNPSNPYGNSYWQAAYDANLAAKTMLDADGFGLNPSYSGIWSVGNEGNKEAILTVKFTAPTRTDGRREQGARPGSQTANDAGADNPVWALLQAYPMKDGYAIGQSPNYTYDEQTFWKNRDPRFDESIVYNGAVYESGGIAGRRQYTDDMVANNDDAYKLDPQARGGTGTYTRKGMQPELKRAEVAQNSVDWIEIRYAEVLLNLAEAANEVGKTPEAIALVQQIRQRAGIDAGSGNYGITASSRDDVRKLIYAERFVEFAFEGQRFWDLKRSRTLTSLNGTLERGVASTLKPANLPVDPAKRDGYQYLPEDFTYSFGPILKAPAAGVTFDIPSNFYFAPIPITQIQKNPKLEQSIDWGGSFNPTLE
ncbi:RagB/SusD family nutrient uptake outer membrane protein [Niabella insulamsoli]|uniref:RagB/SusD family nutrient uptake outer membrane protein n=1 Tax=Niabella insulamsoli TaxID=3144874 RepID=UPI0031FDD017